MGFLDNLKKLTQPMDEEDEFYEGADESFRTPYEKNQEYDSGGINYASEFENSFSAAREAEPSQEPQLTPKQQQALAIQQQSAGSKFGDFLRGGKQPGQPQQSNRNLTPRQATAVREYQGDLYGGNMSVMIFTPRDFNEAGELVNFIRSGRAVLLNLEVLPIELARRILDFISGVSYALECKITQVSAKTYFVSPDGVEIEGK